MLTATTASTATTGTATSGTTTAASDANASQDRFLKLLVAQLNNQDPMNPMDNAQMTSQMAQISTVSSVQQVNFEGSQPEVSLPTERVWQILLACGQQMKLGDLQIVADAGQEAIWGPYKLLLDLANLSSLVRPAESPETIEITDLNGETLIGVTFPPEAYAEGETVYGRLRFPWTDLYLAELLSKISPPTTKPPDVTWSLQTKDGQSIQVQDLHLTHAQLSNPS